MIIRRAGTTDLVGILKVHQEIFPDHSDPSAGYEAAIRNKNGIVLVADNEGEIIGFGLLRASFKGGSALDELYILSEYRSQGIGSDILQQLENCALEQGEKTIRVHAISPNPDDLDRLIRFYEHREYKRLPSGPTTTGVDFEKELNERIKLMANYGIKMELLLPEEQQTLSKLEAELRTNGLLFHRELNDKEMRTVGWIIISLKDRTNDEENNVNFALGDWMNTADGWFGKDTGISWIQELVRLKAYRDHLLGLTGATLIQLQLLEHQVKGCCALLGLTLTLDDLFSTDPERAKRTLGQLIRALRDKIDFDKDFGDRLQALVNNRNRFAHHFWSTLLLNSSTEGIPSVATLEEAEEFISGLLKEAAELQAPFRGLFYYTIGKSMAERNQLDQFLNSELFIEFSKYEKDFLSVINNRDKDDTQGH